MEGMRGILGINGLADWRISGLTDWRISELIQIHSGAENGGNVGEFLLLGLLKQFATDFEVVRCLFL